MEPTYQPVDAAVVPRFAGVATFMRLPLVAGAAGLDIALYGIPWDGGTTNRAGARHGPREVRNQSSLIRRVHHVSGTAPFSLARVADVGDVPMRSRFDLADGLARIEAGVEAIVAAGALPLGIGGDHLATLPVLRAVARRRPVGLIQFDAHSDTNDSYFGNNRYTHGTPFRRAVEEGLIDPKRAVQIGIRGSVYEPGEHDWARAQGIRVVYMEEFCARGPAAVMDEARRIAGAGPTYVTFDIDCIDPSMAPGTGSPADVRWNKHRPVHRLLAGRDQRNEIGGLTAREAQHLVRLLDGVDIVGADVVEVSPPFDVAGLTALTAGTIAFELVCVMARAVKRGSG